MDAYEDTRPDYGWEDDNKEDGKAESRDTKMEDRKADDGEWGRRSRSPEGARRRSQSPSRDRDETSKAGSENEGSNLFVTGLALRVTESDLKEVFGKYGTVEKASIMLDPHTRDSRGFGFVKFVLSEDADKAKEALQGYDLSGRTLNIEKARRSRPRTPTPGKYYGPPKRDGRPPRFDERRRGGGRYDDRYGGGYSGRRGDPYDRYDRGDRGGDRGDRGYGRSYGGDRYGDRGGDRYGRYDDRNGGGDRYGSRAPPADDRYGGSSSRYDGGDRYGSSRYDAPPPA